MQPVVVSPTVGHAAFIAHIGCCAPHAVLPPSVQRFNACLFLFLSQFARELSAQGVELLQHFSIRIVNWGVSCPCHFNSSSNGIERCALHTYIYLRRNMTIQHAVVIASSTRGTCDNTLLVQSSLHHLMQYAAFKLSHSHKFISRHMHSPAVQRQPSSKARWLAKWLSTSIHFFFLRSDSLLWPCPAVLYVPRAVVAAAAVLRRGLRWQHRRIRAG